MDDAEYIASNRALWNEWTTIHEGSEFYDLEGFKRGGVRLRPFELEHVGDVKGKDLLHLQCHFGIDTLSWARLGARVTGADFSERAVELASSIAKELGIAARFVLSNLYELPSNLEGDFDVIYTGRGAIPWLPELREWGRVIAHFLRPGGLFYIHEGHPVMWVMEDEEGVTDLKVKYPYFRTEKPLRFEVQGSYADPTAHVDTPFEYSWNHQLDDVVMSLIEAGLVIELLEEHPFLDWPLPFLEEGDDGLFRLPKDHEGGIPLSFSLKARKPTDDAPTNSQPA